MKMHVKKNDKVIVISGEDAGVIGNVIEAMPKSGKVVVKGVNIVKKHVKPRKAGDPSGIIETEGAIYACKVQLVCPKCGKATRVGTKVYEDGSKERVCKECGATF